MELLNLAAVFAAFLVISIFALTWSDIVISRLESKEKEKKNVPTRDDR